VATMNRRAWLRPWPPFAVWLPQLRIGNASVRIEPLGDSLGRAAHNERQSCRFVDCPKTHSAANFSIFSKGLADWLCPGAGSLCSVGRRTAVGPGWVFGWRGLGPRRRALSERLPAVPPFMGLRSWASVPTDTPGGGHVAAYFAPRSTMASTHWPVPSLALGWQI
jgi:hypothetical protein